LANACGMGAGPATIYVTTTDCGPYELAFSPNPTSSKLAIELTEESPTDKQIRKVEIVDGTGHSLKVWYETGRKLLMDITGLPKGFCYVRVTVNEKTSTTRIIVD
jgi:Secretion system C-terminal sorting domain